MYLEFLKNYMFIENGKKKVILKNIVEILMCNFIRESL